MDVNEHLVADVKVSGTMPSIPRGSKIKVDDYYQQFSKAGPGYISSKTEHLFSVEGSRSIVTFSVDQTITWNECSGSQGLHLTRSSSSIMRLNSTRNFIIYDQNDQIVRYSLTSSISPLSLTEDPCAGVDCGAAGVCLVTGASHACSCLPGYMLGEDGLCEDVDECSVLDNVCHQDADCINSPGSYTCTCKEGFIGDGSSCLEEKTCEELACSDNAECVTNKQGQGECVCRRGYKGNGYTCDIIPSDGRFYKYS